LKTRNFILALSAILFWMANATCRFALAQENYYIKTFTTENGLSYNAIRSITQDKTGFLWIATWDGLSRYDGYEFKNYYHRPNDSTSIPFFAIEKLVVDKMNNLWVLLPGYLPVIYNRSNDQFCQSFKPKVTSKFYDVTTDADGNVWLSGEQGLEKFDCTTQAFKHFDIIGEDFERVTFNDIKPYISLDSQGNIWIFIHKDDYIQIYKSTKFETDHIKFIKYNPLRFKNLLLNRNLYNYMRSYHIVPTTKNNYWLITNFGLLFKSNSDRVFEVFNGELSKEEFTNTPSFSSGMDNSSILFHDSVHQVNHRIVLNSRQLVSSTYVDKQNSYWYSTLQISGEGSGLSHAIKTPSFFKHYFLDQNKNNDLNAYFPVLKTKNGEIWAGPRNLNRIFRIGPDGKLIQCNELDQDTWRNADHPRAFLEDSAGVWIGYFRNMLMYFDCRNKIFIKKIVKVLNDGTLNNPNSFYSLEPVDQDLLINGGRSIYRYNPRNGNLSFLWGNNNDLSIYCIRRDNKNHFWLGLQNSTIKCFNLDFKEIASYVLCNDHYNVQDICIGNHHDLYMALLGEGIAHLDLTTSKTDFLTTENGLSNNTCYNILKDKSGKLWISTNHGISQYDPELKLFRIFGPGDGLKIDEFDAGASFLSNDGEMLFGGVGGVVGFYPDRLNNTAESQQIQPLVITDFKVSGIPRLFKKAIYDLDTVILEKGEDNFQLSFACIDFKNADKIKYRFQLIGEDHLYTETDHLHRFVHYANLVPGNYQIKIEATNSQGAWVSKSSLVILIPPHFYQVIWFKLGIILFLLLIASAFIVFYIRQIRIKATQEQAQLRLESLRGQMNPHFIFNSLNSINYFISQNDRLSANRYIADFSRLIRSFLGNLSKEFIPFERELESLRDYLQLEHLRFGDKFDYSIEINDELDTERLSVFPGMVQPFIENAVWHGVRGLLNRKGIVTIKFLPGSDTHIVCLIEDDSIGRKLAMARENRENGRKSRGIGIVTERLRIINQMRKSNLRLIIEDCYSDREETGTRVTIEIPKDK